MKSLLTVCSKKALTILRGEAGRHALPAEDAGSAHLGGQGGLTAVGPSASFEEANEERVRLAEERAALANQAAELAKRQQSFQGRCVPLAPSRLTLPLPPHNLLTGATSERQLPTFVNSRTDMLVCGAEKKTVAAEEERKRLEAEIAMLRVQQAGAPRGGVCGPCALM